MNIYIDTCEVKDGEGKVIAVHPTATVEYSPREGYKPEAMADLEKELQELLERRLSHALKHDY